MATPASHRWEYCAHCKSDFVVCGKCGNNCCNGGSSVGCPDSCADAYRFQEAGTNRMSASARNVAAARQWIQRGRRGINEGPFEAAA